MKNIKKMSVERLAREIRSKNLSVEEVVITHIQQIKKVNKKINAVVHSNFKGALEQAREYDAKIQSGKMKDFPPLYGVPCTIKESFAVEGFPNTSGIVKRKDVIAQEDATVVRRVKEAGAIVMGVTNVPEACAWIETKNSLYGRSSNPFDINRTCGGSSGGEGAIIATGASPFGLGNDSAGSIRFPAFFCGIVGHKPSHCMIPNTGGFGVDQTGEIVVSGPMGRTVMDMKLITELLVGPDEKDPFVKKKIDLTKVLPPKKKIRVFFLYEIPGFKVSKVIKKNLEYLKRKLEGAGLQTEEYIPKHASLCLKFLEVSQESTEDVSPTEVLRDEKFKVGNEFIKLIRGKSDHIFTNFMFLTLEKLTSSLANKNKNFSEIIERRDEMIAEVTNKLGEDGVLIMPTFTQPAPKHHHAILKPLDFVYGGLLSILRLPVTQVPTGFTSEGLPLGVQVAAAPYNDSLCWKTAEIVEEIFGGWKMAKV